MKILLLVVLVLGLTGCNANKYNAIGKNGPVYKEQCDFQGIASAEYFNSHGCTADYQR